MVEMTEDDTDDRNTINGDDNSAVATRSFPFRKCSSYSFRLPSGAERLILLASATRGFGSYTGSIPLIIEVSIGQIISKKKS